MNTKKIISFILLIFLIITTNIYTINASSNWSDRNTTINKQWNVKQEYTIDIEKYNKLLKDQTKKELEVEIKLFKLQRKIVTWLETSYRDLDAGLKDYVQKINENKNKNFITSDQSNIQLKWNGSKNINNLSLGLIKEGDEILNINSKMFSNITKYKDKYLFNEKWNFTISFLKQTFNGKYFFDILLNGDKLYISIKNFFIWSDLKYNNSFTNLFLDNKKEDNTKVYNTWKSTIEKTINTFNKNIFKITNKNIEISEWVNYNQNLQQWLNSYKAYNFYFENIIQQSWIHNLDKIIELLKTEKIFKVYWKVWSNKYKIFINNDLILKINKLAGKNIIPFITYKDFVNNIERKHLNVIEVLNNWSFKYLTKEIKDKKLLNVTYIIFDENNISTFLMKKENNIVYLNKNKLKLRLENLVWFFSFADNEYKWKFNIKNNNLNVKLLFYIKEKLKWWIIKLIWENKDTKLDFDFNIENEFLRLNTDEIKVNGKFYAKLNTNSNIPYFNKDWILDFSYNYFFGKNKMTTNIDIKDTSLLPINISWNINNLRKYEFKTVLLWTPKKIDIKEKTLNSFYENLIK